MRELTELKTKKVTRFLFFSMVMRLSCCAKKTPANWRSSAGHTGRAWGEVFWPGLKIFGVLISCPVRHS